MRDSGRKRFKGLTYPHSKKKEESQEAKGLPEVKGGEAGGDKTEKRAQKKR